MTNDKPIVSSRRLGRFFVVDEREMAQGLSSYHVGCVPPEDPERDADLWYVFLPCQYEKNPKQEKNGGGGGGDYDAEDVDDADLRGESDILSQPDNPSRTTGRSHESVASGECYEV